MFIEIIFVFSAFFIILQYAQNSFERQDIRHCKPSFFGVKKGEVKNVVKEFRNIYQKYRHSGRPFTGFYILLQPIILLTDLNFLRIVLFDETCTFPKSHSSYNRHSNPLTPTESKFTFDLWLNEKPLRADGLFLACNQIGYKLTSTIQKSLKARIKVDLPQLIKCFAVDVSSMAILGLESNCLDGEDIEFCEVFQKLTTEYNIVKDSLVQIWPCAGKQLKIENNRLKITEELKQLVLRKIKRQKGKTFNASSQSVKYSLNEITIKILELLCTHYEAIVSSLTNCLYELSFQPEIQSKIRRDIQQLTTKNHFLNARHFEELTYLKMVVFETLRKHPVVPFIQRIAAKTYKNPHTTYTIKKNTLVFIPVEAIHHDERFYPVPNKFIPARFLPEEILQRPQMAYLPFGDGPRNCIGQRIAIMQIMIGVFACVKSFELSAENNEILFKKVGKL